MWKGLRHLRIIPKPMKALHGYSHNELNSHFSGVMKGLYLKPSRLITLSLLFPTFSLRQGGSKDYQCLLVAGSFSSAWKKAHFMVLKKVWA